MDPNNYTPQETNPVVDQSTKTWFDSIDSPNPLPSTSEPEPSGKKWKLAVIVIGCVLLAAIAFAYVATTRTQPAAVGKCLDNSNYQEFLGTKNEDALQPQENFYTQSIRFDTDETNFPDDKKTATNNYLKNIGTFYQNNQGESSIVIFITSDYLAGKSAQVAQARATKLKQALVEYGVAESAITTNKPQAITTEDESATDVSAIVSISSHAKCQ